MLEHAAALDAWCDLGALELNRDLRLDRLVEPHLLQVDVLEAAAHRVVLLLLDHDRHCFGTLDLQVEEGDAFAEHVSDIAFGHLEGARLRAAAVDDAGHQALAPQAACGSRAELGSGCSLELFASTGHADRRG